MNRLFMYIRQEVNIIERRKLLMGEGLVDGQQPPEESASPSAIP